jgi:hypothetical protein
LVVWKENRIRRFEFFLACLRLELISDGVAGAPFGGDNVQRRTNEGVFVVVDVGKLGMQWSEAVGSEPLAAECTLFCSCRSAGYQECNVVDSCFGIVVDVPSAGGV